MASHRMDGGFESSIISSKRSLVAAAGGDFVRCGQLDRRRQLVAAACTRGHCRACVSSADHPSNNSDDHSESLPLVADPYGRVSPVKAHAEGDPVRNAVAV